MKKKASLYEWFMFMLSIPRAKPMTRTETFTQWSSLLAYCLGGGSLLVIPGLWKLILQLQFEGHSEGYLRLVGLGVLDIGFMLIIAARSNQKAPGHGSILWSVLSRVVVVNGILLMLTLRDMIPLSFALVFMALDTLLPLITLVIWCRETEGASVSLFCHEILSTIFQFPLLKVGYSVVYLFSLGLFQIVFWLVFVVTPTTAQKILLLDSFQGYSDGYLASVFFTLSIHGMYHVTNACVVNLCFVPASLFYRVLWNVPVLFVLFLVGQIERNLSIALLGFDLMVSLILLILVTCEKRTDSTVPQSDERAMLTAKGDE